MKRAASLAIALSVAMSMRVGAQEAPSDPNLVREKLANIFVSVDFTNASIDEAVKYLTAESKRLASDHKGINFIIAPTAAASAKPVTLKLDNVPLNETLRYLCDLAGVRYKVEASAVAIVQPGNSEAIVGRTFNVPPSFVAPPANSTVPNLPTP